MTHSPRTFAVSAGGVACASSLILVLLLAPAGEAFAQSISHVTVLKVIHHVQTSATTVAVDPLLPGPAYGGPYGFDVTVLGQNLGSIAAPVVTGPFNVARLGSFYNSGRLVYNAEDGEWRLGSPNANGWGSPTRSDLDSNFGSGTYTVSVNGNSIPLQLAGDAYPAAPVFALSGGNWVNGEYVIDPGMPLTLTTSAFTGYGSNVNGVMVLGVEEFGRIVQGADEVPSPNFLTVTVPANTFVSGRKYEAFASFQAIVSLRLLSALPGTYSSARYLAGTSITIKAETPVFPMVVTGSIGPVSGNITATIQYRPQDVGTTGSVYVFAVAPADIVRPAANGSTFKIGRTVPADGGKADSVACVLAQLNSSGQLQAVTTSSLQAYITGVLSAQGQAVTILNGVPTVNIGGATFYVGYGTSAAAMINSGINRSAVTAPGTRVCKPQPPQTGWWWNPTEAGRGFSIEASGNKLFMATYLYDVSGRSTWHVATGPTSIDGSVFNNQLLSFGNGVTLTGPYAPNAPLPNAGPISLTFDDAQHGTLVWPGGTLAIQRFPVSATGPATPSLANQPESGWWWGGAADSGRGFFIEWQGANAFLAGYMYDAAGNATWYVAQNAAPITNPQAFQGTWLSLANGQTLTGAYRAPSPATSVSPVTIQFQGADAATLTLSGRQIPLTRFRF